ncbi:MAG TPA: hypothetical protein VGC41_24570, partial [Kofleriaceae bacterium]
DLREGNTIIEALHRTSRVVVRTPELDRLHPRLVTHDGPGFLHAGRRASAILPVPLARHQRHYGIVAIRAQLARTLPDGYALHARGAALSAVAPGPTLVRRNDVWTLKTDRIAGVMIDGVAYEGGHNLELRDRAIIRIDNAEAMFCARDLDARFRAP